jgi:hypothetical protein
MFRGEQMYVEPLTLVLQPTATRVNCRTGTPPRWKTGRSDPLTDRIHYQNIDQEN